MSTFFLVNKVRLGVRTLLPGAPINDAVDDTAAIEAAGGRLYPSANATVAAAAALAQSLALRGQHDQAAGIMLAAASKADALGADTATADNATPAIVNATATNQNTTAENLAEQRSGHVRYTNPPAADLVSIVTTLDPVADGALVLEVTVDDLDAAERACSRAGSPRRGSSGPRRRRTSCSRALCGSPCTAR